MQQYDINVELQSSSKDNEQLLLKSVKEIGETSSEDKFSFENKIRDKFRGCLVGALVGDCIGTLFECDYSVSYKILGDLYLSLTNLSEDEKLMDLHGIDFSIGPKLAQELLERKKSIVQIQRNSVMPPSPEEIASKIPKRHSSFERRRGSFSRPIEKFSDDTVMTRSVVTSLIRMKGFDVRDMAKQLTEDCFLNRTRKFGGFNRDIFTQLREIGYNDPFTPARKAAGNIGSLGNEGATRVASISLIGWNSDPGTVVDMASKLSKITNYHKSAVIGAVWQAIAIQSAFNWDLEVMDYPFSQHQQRRSSRLSPLPRRKHVRNKSQENIPLKEGNQGDASKDFDHKAFCKNILEAISKVDGRASSIMENLKSFVNPNREANKTGEAAYMEKLATIVEFMERSEPPQRAEVVEKLGNGTKALDSVPTAMYAFIMAASTSKFPELPVQIKSPVLRSIFYAISFGGDSDTIASMAGSIAGAYWGYRQIPQEILRVCEGSRETVNLADDLFNNFFQ